MKQTKTPLLINPRYKTKKIRGKGYVFDPNSINDGKAWLSALASTAPKLIGFLI